MDDLDTLLVGDLVVEYFGTDPVVGIVVDQGRDRALRLPGRPAFR